MNLRYQSMHSFPLVANDYSEYLFLCTKIIIPDPWSSSFVLFTGLCYYKHYFCKHMWVYLQCKFLIEAWEFLSEKVVHFAFLAFVILRSPSKETITTYILQMSLYVLSRGSCSLVISRNSDHQPRLDAWDKCSDLGHWEEPEGSGGEGGGRGDWDGEYM